MYVCMYMLSYVTSRFIQAYALKVRANGHAQKKRRKSLEVKIFV